MNVLATIHANEDTFMFSTELDQSTLPDSQITSEMWFEISSHLNSQMTQFLDSRRRSLIQSLRYLLIISLVQVVLMSLVGIPSVLIIIWFGQNGYSVLSWGILALIGFLVLILGVNMILLVTRFVLIRIAELNAEMMKIQNDLDDFATDHVRFKILYENGVNGIPQLILEVISRDE